jgi:hypothetical protein
MYCSINIHTYIYTHKKEPQTRYPVKMKLQVYFNIFIVCTLVLLIIQDFAVANSYEEREVVLDNSHIEKDEETYTVSDKGNNYEAESSSHLDKSRKEESGKALERVFAACTDACSITTAGIKLRETIEKNKKLERTNKMQYSIIQDQKITIATNEENIVSLSNRLGAEEANHNELNHEFQKQVKAYSDLQTEISIVNDKVDMLTPENERLKLRILELENEKLRGLDLLEKANNIVSNLKAENAKMYNELKDLNVQMEAQKAKQNLIANFESTLAQIHSKISSQIVELNETKESRVKDRDQFLQEKLEFKKYSEEKEKVAIAKEQMKFKEKIEHDATAETVDEDIANRKRSNQNHGNEDNSMNDSNNNNISIVFSLLSFMFDNLIYSLGFILLLLFICSKYGNIWMHEFDKFMKPRAVRSRNGRFSASTPARLMPTPLRGSREEIANFSFTNRDVIQSPMRQRFK